MIKDFLLGVCGDVVGGTWTRVPSITEILLTAL